MPFKRRHASAPSASEPSDAFASGSIAEPDAFASGSIAEPGTSASPLMSEPDTSTSVPIPGSSPIEPAGRVAAGRGAARIALPAGRYVYGAWSRRARGASLGVDLTPDGECSVACVYCQVPRSGSAKGRPAVDLSVLRAELERALSLAPASGWADLAFAGSGEPTLAANFGPAVSEILAILGKASFAASKRIYTNGLHVGVEEVERGFAQWASAGGEVWFKMDALDDRSIERVWRVRLSAEAHFARLWRVAARMPIGLQCTLFHADGLPPLADIGRSMARELERARSVGARILAVHLLAPSRSPGDRAASAGIVPATIAELEGIAKTLREATRLPVSVYA